MGTSWQDNECKYSVPVLLCYHNFIVIYFLIIDIPWLVWPFEFCLCYFSLVIRFLLPWFASSQLRRFWLVSCKRWNHFEHFIWYLPDLSYHHRPCIFTNHNLLSSVLYCSFVYPEPICLRKMWAVAGRLVRLMASLGWADKCQAQRNI